MQWPRLVNDRRFGHPADDNKAGTRSDFRRDYDRLVFSSPFRRLQNKTQVFPLPGSIFVHNRLTHSLEVSSVGRSIAEEVKYSLRDRYPAGSPEREALESISEIVAAACLAHDLGNPPFGHSGEKAIGTFFSEGEGKHLQSRLTDAQWHDLINFEGNANSLRVLIHPFKGRREGGFGMTYSTLASIVKYPYDSLLSTKGKFGFFNSERDSYDNIARELGIICYSADGDSLHYARHPLVYIVEAADDICYEIMDLEDAHKLKILSADEVIPLLLNFFDDNEMQHHRHAIGLIDDPNEKIAHLRSAVISKLVTAVAATFVANEDAILAGTFRGTLIHAVEPRLREAYDACNALSWAKIYCAGDVVDIELAGNRIITFLLSKFIHAVRFPELNYSKLLLSKIPRQYDVTAPELFDRIQAVLDHISAMTDVYALDLYRKLNGSSLPAI